MTRYRFISLMGGVSFAGQGAVTEFSDATCVIEDLGGGRVRVTKSIDAGALGDWDVVELPWSNVSAAYPKLPPVGSLGAATKAASQKKK